MLNTKRERRDARKAAQIPGRPDQPFSSSLGVQRRIFQDVRVLRGMPKGKRIAFEDFSQVKSIVADVCKGELKIEAATHKVSALATY